MCEITEKLGVKVAAILLFSVFILAGLNVTQAYGQPLDSPLYSHTNTEAVEAMNAPADTNSVADANRPEPAEATIYSVGSLCCRSTEDTKSTCLPIPCVFNVPVMFPAGEIVFILTLTGGACWAILRKKRS